jgi:hypothetical protein
MPSASENEPLDGGLKALVRRAEAGDAEALRQLRGALDGSDGSPVWRLTGDLAAQAEAPWWGASPVPTRRWPPG